MTCVDFINKKMCKTVPNKICNGNVLKKPQNKKKNGVKWTTKVRTIENSVNVLEITRGFATLTGEIW